MTTDDYNAAMQQWLQALHPKQMTQDSRPVYIVSGAPGSGKTTYVSQKKHKGDLVLDMDLLTAALQGESAAHPEYKTVFDAALAAREAVYSTIEHRKGDWKQAFVITSNPKKEIVNELAKRLKGTIVQMQTEREECIRRIENDSTRTNPTRDKELANLWFEQV